MARKKNKTQKEEQKEQIKIQVVQVTLAEKDENLSTIKESGLLLELQPYGIKEEQLFHFAFPENLSLSFGRQITDRGRTTGFWQSLGGSGVYKPKMASLTFSNNLYKIISSAKEADIDVSGDTWVKVIEQLPRNKVINSFL